MGKGVIHGIQVHIMNVSKRVNTTNYIKRAKPDLKILYGFSIWIHDLAKVYNSSKAALNISRIEESN